MRHFFAIFAVWVGCALGWVVLGSTLVVRSGESSSELTDEVHALWGPPLEQGRPGAGYHELVKRRQTVTTTDAAGRATTTEVEKDEDTTIEVPLVASDIAARIDLAQRRKGLLWFPTYAVDFRGRYTFENPDHGERAVQLQLPLAGAQTIFDGFQVEDDAGRAMPLTITSGAARWSARFAPGEQRSFTVRYRSRGTTRFGYQLADASGGQVKSFHLALDTNFAAVDFPPGSLSPSSHGRTPAGWHGDWRFATLVGANPIALALPQPLNPGPLAARITFFAPVGLLFFFFVVAVLASSRNLRIHPLNYFFFGCAFFAFHLLFGYLVDHLAIGPSFSISAAVSIALVTSYARLFVGERFAFVEMAIAQLLYLVLFSFTFFWTGFTGLAITVGAILTLFVMMQVTGRVRWSAAAKPPVAHS